MACYRTMRQTAVRLAQAGWGSLRFDFFGCGDSEGATPEGRPERWVRDIGSAADDIRARLPRAPMSFLGIRLGATLALQYSLSADAAECDALVLWDPIVKGRDYVAELTSLQRERFGTSAEDEALGMPLGPALRAELERIDLLGAECPNAGRVLIVETGAPSTHVSDLAERLRAAGSNVSRRRFETAAVWSDTQKAAVPNAVIQAVVNWMRGQ
jgi:pimeloyl-ACP methyl ester carboxylesterase